MTRFGMIIALIACIPIADSPPVYGNPVVKSGPEMLQRGMVLVNQIDWRLRRVAGRNCRRSIAGTGIVLDSLLAYNDADWPALGMLLGLGEQPQIIGMAAGSPAEAAGLAVGDRIVAIDGISPMDLMLRKGDRYALPENILGAIPQSGGVRFEVERGRNRLSMNVRTIAICAGMIVVKISQKADAFSDSDNIAITTGMIAQLDTPDEIAFVIGHELGHIIFEDSKLHGISRVRKEERADLYGAFLATCAGFNPEGAISALQKLKLRARGRLALPWIHRSFGRRQESIRSFIGAPPNCGEGFEYRRR